MNTHTFPRRYGHLSLVLLSLSLLSACFPEDFFGPTTGASPQPSASSTQVMPSPQVSATPVATPAPVAVGHYQKVNTDVFLLDGKNLGYRPESDAEIRRVVSEKGLEWTNGSVTIKLNVEFNGRINHQTATMNWTPPPESLQRDQVLNLGLELRLSVNDTDLFLNQSLDAVVDVGDIAPGMRTGGGYSLLNKTLEIGKDTPNGTVLNGGTLNPLKWGGDQLTLRIVCFSGQVGAEYLYRYRWVK